MFASATPGDACTRVHLAMKRRSGSLPATLGTPPVDELLLAPRAAQEAREALELLGRETDRIVGGDGESRRRVEQDQPRAARRVLRDEAEQKRTRVGAPHHRGRWRADRIEHGEQVLAPVLRDGAAVVGARIGEPRAARVEADHAAERREPREIAQRGRILEHHVDLAPQADRVDEIGRPVPQCLIGDAVLADGRKARLHALR